MNKTIRSILTVTFTAVFLSVFALSYLLYAAQHSSIRQNAHEIANVEEVNDWIMDGEPIMLPMKISQPGKTVVIERTFYPTDDNHVLFFSNERQGITASVDGEVLYRVNNSELANTLMVKNDALVYLPERDEPFTLRLEFSNYRSECSLPVIRMDSYYGVAAYAIQRESVTIIHVAILIVMAFVMTLSTLFYASKHFFDRRLPALIAFLVSVSLWTFCDSPLTSLFTIPPEVFGLISFTSFMAVPVTVTLWVERTCGKNYVGLRLTTMVGMLNMAVQLLLAMFQIARLDQMLLMTHATVVLTIAVTLPYSIIEERKRPVTAVTYLKYGLILLSVASFGSLIVYWLHLPSRYYRMSMLFGITIFLISQLYGLIYAFQEVIRTSRQKQNEAALYARIAMQDQLTSLGNRRAYEDALHKLNESLQPQENAVLTILDLNGLKYTNDAYGHTAGDDLIVAAAECIREAYSDGECFRIGGDEFAVIVRGKAAPLNEETKHLQALIDQYNRESRFQLSIAKGECSLLNSAGKHRTFANWRQEADINMYVDKVEYHRNNPALEKQELRNIIECIITAMEARDPYTANHSIRVAEIAVMIARHLGLSQRTLNSVRDAALLHDIGKIGIPDAILRKPDRLDAEEYEIAKRHAEIGARIIGRAPSMAETAEMIRYHHERYSGGGYPTGVHGEDIPIGARIIALADSIDAMITDRSYRKGLSLDICRKEIAANLGGMYDPAIGKIVLENWEELEQLAQKQKNQLPRFPDLTRHE